MNAHAAAEPAVKKFKLEEIEIRLESDDDDTNQRLWDSVGDDFEKIFTKHGFKFKRSYVQNYPSGGNDGDVYYLGLEDPTFVGKNLKQALTKVLEDLRDTGAVDFYSSNAEIIKDFEESVRSKQTHIVLAASENEPSNAFCHTPDEAEDALRKLVSLKVLHKSRATLFNDAERRFRVTLQYPGPITVTLGTRDVEDDGIECDQVYIELEIGHFLVYRTPAERVVDIRKAARAIMYVSREGAKTVGVGTLIDSTFPTLKNIRGNEIKTTKEKPMHVTSAELPPNVQGATEPAPFAVAAHAKAKIAITTIANDEDDPEDALSTAIEFYRYVFREHKISIERDTVGDNNEGDSTWDLDLKTSVPLSQAQVLKLCHDIANCSHTKSVHTAFKMAPILVSAFRNKGRDRISITDGDVAHAASELLGSPHTLSFRCLLNPLPRAEEKFVAWVESTLKKCGCTFKKVELHNSDTFRYERSPGAEALDNAGMYDEAEEEAGATDVDTIEITGLCVPANLNARALLAKAITSHPCFYGRGGAKQFMKLLSRPGTVHAAAEAVPEPPQEPGKYIHAVDGKIRGLLQLLTKWTAAEKSAGREDLRKLLILCKKEAWPRLSEASQKKLLELK